MTRQYIGARYVPIIDGEYNSEKVYEPLTIVTYNGSSYTSKKSVPAGTLPTNTEYWALTGNYNAQVEQYLQEVSAYKTETDEAIEDLSCFATPQMYGAVADGITDDSEAFRSALRTNKIVYVPEGTYLIGSTVVLNENDPDNAGYRSIISNGAKIKSSTLAFDNNGSGRIKGLTFELSSQSDTAIGVKLSGWRSHIESCTFLNQHIGVIINDDAVVVRDCTFANGNIALCFPNETPLQTMTIIEDCTFQYQSMCLHQENNVAPVGIYCVNTSFEQNTQCWDFTNFANWSFINCWFEANAVDSIRPRWCVMINTRLNGANAGIVTPSTNWTTEIVGGNIVTTKLRYNNGLYASRQHNALSRNIASMIFKIKGNTGECVSSLDSSEYTFTKVGTGVYEVTFPSAILNALSVHAYPLMLFNGYASELNAKTQIGFDDAGTYADYLTVNRLRINVTDDSNNPTDAYVVIEVINDEGAIVE